MLVDIINTRDMLCIRNCNIGLIFPCIMYHTGVDETTNHIFLRCVFSSECWAKCGVFFNTSLPLAWYHGISPYLQKLWVEAMILSTSGVELHELSLMHMHQSQRNICSTYMSLTKQMHQCWLRILHQIAIIPCCKATNLGKTMLCLSDASEKLSV
jgi:hypothetical protein